MFESHIALGVTLLALVAAAGLLVFSSKAEGCVKRLAKVVAYAALIIGVLSIICITYYTIRYSQHGYFKTPYGKNCPMMDGKGMPMMDHHGMMKGDKMKKSGPETVPSEDHLEHHP